MNFLNNTYITNEKAIHRVKNLNLSNSCAPLLNENNDIRDLLYYKKNC